MKEYDPTIEDNYLKKIQINGKESNVLIDDFRNFFFFFFFQ